MALYTASSSLIFSWRSRLYARLTPFEQIRPQAELLIIEVPVYSASPSALANTKCAPACLPHALPKVKPRIKESKEEDDFHKPRSRMGDYAVTFPVSDLVLHIIDWSSLWRCICKFQGTRISKREMRAFDFVRLCLASSRSRSIFWKLAEVHSREQDGSLALHI